MAALTPRQERFVEEYLRDLNATQAAIRSGYSARSAAEIGRQLLEKTGVAEAVARAKAERSARLGLTQDRVLEELAAVGARTCRGNCRCTLAYTNNPQADVREAA